MLLCTYLIDNHKRACRQKDNFADKVPTMYYRNTIICQTNYMSFVNPILRKGNIIVQIRVLESRLFGYFWLKIACACVADKHKSCRQTE